jgi:[ribosomal protein S5]-alanine N-acetyltransferase
MATPRLRFPDAVPTLHDEHVRLREVTEADLPAWYERATDAESAALAGDPIPASPALGAAWLARIRERWRLHTGIRWTVTRRGSDTSVGSIGLAIVSAGPPIAELGLVIARAHWGHGLGTAATRLVARFGFETLGLAQIRAELLQSNRASRRMLEKAGFALQAVIPDFEPGGAHPEDGYLYVLGAARQNPPPS